ncbi:MAG: hypothetical protein EBZ74_02490 [Planctomycetia bacterium]|nr:hypothetical protein [Planctomycetia bacterium]
MSFRYLLRIDWDVVAGIAAAITAMLLSFMGLVSETVSRGIILLLCALLLVRDLRREAREHRMFDKLDTLKRHVTSLSNTVRQTDVCLVGPKRMRQDFAEFAASIYGEVRWFNACCRMFHRQEVFDATMRPLLDNPNVTSIHMLCRPDERRHWEADLGPKLRRCENGGKVHAPLWVPIRGTVSFLLGDVDGDGRDEALVSVLDEPFAAYNTQGPTVPRYLLRVYSQSPLMLQLEEIARQAMTDFETDADPAGAEVARVAPPPASA